MAVRILPPPRVPKEITLPWSSMIVATVVVEGRDFVFAGMVTPMLGALREAFPRVIARPVDAGYIYTNTKCYICQYIK